jgi:hypothetical protein
MPRRAFSLTALALALLAGALAVRALVHDPPPRRMASPDYGIQTFFWYTADNKTGDNDVRLVGDLGFGWIKQKLAWVDLEVYDDTWDWSRADLVIDLVDRYALKMLARLGGTPFWAKADPELAVTDAPPTDNAEFAEYCGAVAERYRGRIDAYEIWNEPNLAREWGNQAPDPAAYVELLRVCAAAIRAADPNALIFSAGLAPTDESDPAIAMPDLAFYEGFYDAGGHRHVDLIGAHAPGYGLPPEISPDEVEADPFWASRVWCFRRVEDIRALMVRRGDGARQIAITEMGWTTAPASLPQYHWYAVTPEQQADYLVRAYRFAYENWRPWIGLMSMIYITNPFWTEADEQYWWSTTRPVFPGDPPDLLPAYFTLQQMPKPSDEP